MGADLRIYVVHKHIGVHVAALYANVVYLPLPLADGRALELKGKFTASFMF